MATSVEVDESTKDRLEQLQAEIKLATGRKVTQQELLNCIVRREFESKAALIDSFREEFEGLPGADFEQWLSGTTASGNPVDEDDIDRVLYGDEAREQ